MLEAISAQDIAVMGLKAQRVRMNIIANNIANSQTTRAPGTGQAFRRQMVLLKGEPIKPWLSNEKYGVRVARIVSDPSPLREVYDPGHPDANADGIVSYPNVDLAMEMVDLVSAQRAYDANIAVILSGKRMTQQALEIIRV
ncbi:MAG TPA: flagellar basal body rod protein FlgC [Candidatus Hydrogenedentes bacterium]|mgnify:CR=1 FL=1|nr:flagellar basal body rod protein FlgC [Candidatus Hydrogenedentota bacterium]HOL78043.1 flagellar basal body rod protein FlgC [Candidatus Hydrogenedentota bacterium]HPO84597.1 flagellar basal body rod protein FlgC [Candidatus Hydrogenedentota bacterium]